MSPSPGDAFAEVAEQVTGLASDATSYRTGSAFAVDGRVLTGPCNALGADV